MVEAMYEWMRATRKTTRKTTMYELQQCPQLLAHMEVVQGNWGVQSYCKVSTRHNIIRAGK